MGTDPVETHRVLYAVMLGRGLSEREVEAIRSHWGDRRMDPVRFAQDIRNSEEYRSRRRPVLLSSDDWKPFQDAPRDGTAIDVWKNGQRVCDVRYLTDRQVAEIQGIQPPEGYYNPAYDGWRVPCKAAMPGSPSYNKHVSPKPNFDPEGATHFILAPEPPC